MTTTDKLTAAFYGGLLVIGAITCGMLTHTYKKSCDETNALAKAKMDAALDRLDLKTKTNE